MILIPYPNYDSTMQLMLQLVLTCRCPDAAAQVHKMHRVQATGIVMEDWKPMECNGRPWKGYANECVVYVHCVVLHNAAYSA